MSANWEFQENNWKNLFRKTILDKDAEVKAQAELARTLMKFVTEEVGTGGAYNSCIAHVEVIFKDLMADRGSETYRLLESAPLNNYQNLVFALKLVLEGAHTWGFATGRWGVVCF